MQGESIPHLAKRIQNAVQAIGRTRAETIARTETMYAVNQGTLIRYSQAGVSKVKILAGLDERVCFQCESEHGNVYDIDSAPTLPFHPNCVLPGTWAETPGGIVAGLRARYDGEAVKITLANGGYLAVTPNHMLLTPDGFAAAHLLREGDDVLYCPHLERVVPSNPHVDRYPARVEDIIGTLAEAPGMTAARVPVAPEYLHGDGRNADGNIDVIRPDCLLRGASEPVILKHPEAHTLNPGDTRGRSLAAPGDLAAMLERLALAADGGMSGSRESAPLFLRRLGHPQEHGRGTPPRGDTGAPEPAVDNAPGNTEPGGECLDGHAGIVEGDNLLGIDPVAALPRETEFAESPPDDARARPETIRDLLDRQPLVIQTTKVVRIDRRPFHGYIYDLQTPSTLCIYNNVITSNCRCTVIPVIEVPG
jgi:SPP1 gp7 family putative phage head morphogenesis protein